MTSHLTTHKPILTAAAATAPKRRRARLGIAAVPAIAALALGAGAATANADESTPPGCVIQGSGTPCTIAPSGVATTPAASSGPASFANGAIADYMLGEVTQNGGECRDAVDAAVNAVSGGNVSVGGNEQDYNESFRQAGAYQVPDVSQAAKGDIVQVSGDPSSPHLHTYVVVSNLGGGQLDVVDSNHNLDHIVDHYQRDFDYNGDAAISTIWRLGQV